MTPTSCGRINGIIHRMSTGAQRRELPERFGPWKAAVTRCDKRGYVHLGTVTAAALLIRLRS